MELKSTFWKKEEEVLKDYIAKKAVELELDAANRKNGVKTGVGTYKYAGYDNLRNFFDGDHWSIIPEEGSSLRVYNFISTTVLNYTAFMTNEPPEFDVPADEITDEVEVERAERKETILKEILKDNDFSVQFETAITIGGLLGDSFILGPFWDSVHKRIYFSTVKRPENVRPIFSRDDFSVIIGYIVDFYVSKETAEELWGEQIEKRGIRLKEEPIGGPMNQNSNEQTSQQMIHVRQYWDDRYMELLINDQITDFVEHNWGFVPILYVPNLIHPLKWSGISDVENMLDAQTDYNEKNEDINAILKSEAFTIIFGKNLTPTTVQSGVTSLVDLGDEAELIADPRRARTAPLEQVIQDRTKDIFTLSGLNEIFFGGAAVRDTSGRALSVLMQSVNNRIKGRQERWRKMLKKLSANIFKLIEIYVTGGKDLINKTYDVDIFFPGTLLRNITDEINKYTRQLQSRYTTMKNLGVPSPRDEETLLEKEMLATASLQIKVQKMAAEAQMAMQGQPGTPSKEPNLQEYQNQGEQPAAVAGVAEQSPISPEGAIAQGTQRKTGVPNIKQRK